MFLPEHYKHGFNIVTVEFWTRSAMYIFEVLRGGKELTDVIQDEVQANCAIRNDELGTPRILLQIGELFGNDSLPS